ncbi:histidine kinase [Streptomyces sp. DSM 44917]|uniref:histidine kinase n=1 Tax=Streptomyces boetiae TaxID=3075541 RepID=A0ABU2L6G8_9ACTN|nr:histidine kinase [Streptomyces sp. DSM 44917]MDT0307160.1 histidine kinase [Streptomyces sp. DSM 44917]
MHLSARSLRPRPLDVAIAATGLAGGLIGIAFGLFTIIPDREHGPQVLAGLLLMCGAELMRRTAPGWALSLAAVAFVTDCVTGGLLAVILMFSDVVYAAALYGRARFSRGVVTGSGALCVAVTVGSLALLRDADALVLGALFTTVTAGPAWTGLMIREHRETAAAERLRAEQTALLAERDRVQAVAAERSRMARELHDRVANHLSAIALHSTAALTLDEPGTTREALAVIRENSTQGLAEMRGLIGLLRATGAGREVEATPSLTGPGGLDALLAQAGRNAAGAGGRLRFTGLDHRPPDAPRLSAPVELAAYRIVQESLTNAAKHAAEGEVTVVLRQEEGTLSITVTSPYRRPGRAEATAPGARAGLIGMRERAELLEGAFSAGPASPTTWQVRAELPLADPARTPERTARP